MRDFQNGDKYVHFDADLYQNKPVVWTRSSNAWKTTDVRDLSYDVDMDSVLDRMKGLVESGIVTKELTLPVMSLWVRDGIILEGIYL